MTKKKSTFRNIDEKIRNFVANCNNIGTPVTKELIREKAQILVNNTNTTGIGNFLLNK